MGKETSSCEKAFTDKHNVLTRLCGGLHEKRRPTHATQMDCMSSRGRKRHRCRPAVFVSF